MPALGPHRLVRDVSREQFVLILSHDGIAAALLGALIETLGYSVRFSRPREAPEDSVRRVRPRTCLVDCDDPQSFQAEFLGRATMRGICVVIFGTRTALDRVRAFAMAHDVETLTMPPVLEELELVLHTAGREEL
jgi:hypothetical protein